MVIFCFFCVCFVHLQDYTDDACMDHFTQGQFTRMRNVWDNMRANY
jgi:hypothetical protein